MSAPVFYRSDSRPRFGPFTLTPPSVSGFRYSGSLEA